MWPLPPPTKWLVFTSLSGAGPDCCVVSVVAPTKPILRHRSAVSRLLRFWVRIPPGVRIFSVVRIVCCQVEASATSSSLVQRIPTDRDASLCIMYKPEQQGGHGPRWAAAQRMVADWDGGWEDE